MTTDEETQAKFPWEAGLTDGAEGWDAFRIRDYAELYELSRSVTRFVSLRLKAFRELYADRSTPYSLVGHDQASPEAHAEWLNDVDLMIAAFEFVNDEDNCAARMREWPESVARGWELFWKHRFFSLWD